MANELPYFRFTAQAWQNGKISLERYELKGLYIEICGYYWINDCCLTLTILEKKFRNEVKLIKELIDLEILKHEKRHDKIEIEFLNIQFDLLSEKRKARQSAGLKGSIAKALLKQKPSYKDKDNNKDKDKEKDNNKDKFSFKNSLLEFSQNNQLIDDWLLVRKNKKATNTETAFNLFMEQVKISDITIDDILNICIDKSWSGYKFQWVLNLRKTEGNGTTPKNTIIRKSVDDKQNEVIYLASQAFNRLANLSSENNQAGNSIQN